MHHPRRPHPTLAASQERAHRWAGCLELMVAVLVPARAPTRPSQTADAYRTCPRCHLPRCPFSLLHRRRSCCRRSPRRQKSRRSRCLPPRRSSSPVALPRIPPIRIISNTHANSHTTSLHVQPWAHDISCRIARLPSTRRRWAAAPPLRVP